MKTKFSLLLFFLLTTLILKAQDSIPSVTKLLDLSLEELMSIKVVTATGYLQTTSEAPSTITVISAQQIADRGYEQLEDALRDVPGIDMIHLNGYAPTLIYFRGMYGAENLRALLMIDGIAENNIIGSNDMAGPAYSLHNTERVEIIWGPVSALYGANAYGGVINIITKKGGDVDGFHAEQGYGSFNTKFEKINMGVRRSNLEFAASGTLYSTDGPRFTNRDVNYSSSYIDKAISFNGAVNYYSKKSKTTLGYRSFKTPMGWGMLFNSPTVFLGLPSQGYLNKGILGLISRDIRGEKSGLNNPFLRTAFLQNEFKPSEKLNIVSRIVYRETGTSDDSYGYLTLDGKKLIRAIVTSYSNRISGEFALNYSPSKKQNFSAGINYYQDNVENGSRKATLDTNTIYLIDGKYIVTNLYATFLPRAFDIRNNFGSYLQYNLNTELLGKTSFTVGGRYDYNSYFGSVLSPRIAIVNQPNKNFTFKLQYGNAFRAPTNTEIYQAPPNFPLKTEKIRTYEVNGIYSRSKNLRLQLNGFRNELTDVIVIANLIGTNVDKNPGVINVTGVESILDIILSNNISGFVNFTYQDAYGENLISHLSRVVPGVAKFKGNVGLTMHLEDLFIISLSGNWIGKREVPFTDPYGPVNGYFLANCVINTVKLFNNKITASIAIHNMFNAKWLDPGFRTADGFLYSTVLEQPGINALFKIGVTL